MCNNIARLIESNVFHLEQVFTTNNKDNVDVIYLAVTNVQNIKNLRKIIG